MFSTTRVHEPNRLRRGRGLYLPWTFWSVMVGIRLAARATVTQSLNRSSMLLVVPACPTLSLAARRAGVYVPKKLRMWWMVTLVIRRSSTKDGGRPSFRAHCFKAAITCFLTRDFSRCVCFLIFHLK